MKTYDPKRYVISFAGVDLNKGLADGTFLRISPMTARFTSKSGVDGEVTRTRRHDKRRTGEFTTMQTSDVNARLSAIFAADTDAPNGEGVGALLVKDLVGTTVFEATAYIAQDPDLELGPEATTRTWRFEIVDPGQTTHGSNPDTVATPAT